MKLIEALVELGRGDIQAGVREMHAAEGSGRVVRYYPPAGADRDGCEVMELHPAMLAAWLDALYDDQFKEEA